MFKAQQIKELNDSELQVFEFIMNNQLIVPYLTIRELASHSNVSTTTILRFIDKMGFDSYNDFKYAYRLSLQNDSHFEQEYDYSAVIDCLKKFDSDFYRDMFNEAMILIGNSEEIIFIGVGNSGAVCQYGARRFTSSGKFAIAINDPYLKLPGLNRNNLVIVLSVSGETPEIIDLVTSCRQGDCKVLAITTSKSSTLAKLADLTIPYYIKKVGVQMFDMTTQIPAIAVIENLTTMCLKK